MTALLLKTHFPKCFVLIMGIFITLEKPLMYSIVSVSLPSALLAISGKAQGFAVMPFQLRHFIIIIINTPLKECVYCSKSAAFHTSGVKYLLHSDTQRKGIAGSRVKSQPLESDAEKAFHTSSDSKPPPGVLMQPCVIVSQVWELPPPLVCANESPAPLTSLWEPQPTRRRKH